MFISIKILNTGVEKIRKQKQSNIPLSSSYTSMPIAQ